MTNKKKANEDAHKQRAENSRSYLEQEAKNAEKAARQAELNRLSDDDLHKISTGKSTNTRINSANALDEIRERETARRRSSSSSTRRSTKSRSR